MTGLEARGIVEAAVRRELFGPQVGDEPHGKPLDCSSGSVKFSTKEDSWGRWHESTSLEEVLTESDPLRRYGIGILFNGATMRGTSVSDGASPVEADEDLDLTWVSGIGEGEPMPDGPTVAVQGKPRHDEADSDDFDLTDANTFKPSAMAVSFKCRVPAAGSMAVTVSGAYYDKVSAHIAGIAKPRDWWVRRPFELTGTIAGPLLLRETNKLKNIETTPASGKPPRIAPTTQVFARPVPGETDPELRLVTIALVNRAPGIGAGSALFQMGFTVTATDGLTIEPYPEIDHPEYDDEDQSIDLLYRHKRTYAIGHGCAAEWDDGGGQTTRWVRAEPMPAYEVMSLTPDVYITDASGTRTPVTVSMDALANGTADGHEQVKTVLRLYEEWILEQEGHISTLLPRFQAAAERHVRMCRDALARIQTGWQMVGSNPTAARAFQLANQAMLYQQLRSRLPLRETEKDKNGFISVQGPHPSTVPMPGSGNWRPFQIAFVLASLPELVDPTLPSRKLVDLIFFPTGGGKTEAYLGASAISLLARRLRDKEDTGTDTLMRYTLRLLTAQQFLRAAALICVLEDIRSKNADELGESAFGIGIWLGGTSTPNSWARAVKDLGRLGKHHQAQNVFLLLRCPWCATQMGTKTKDRGGQDVFGYEQVGNKVVFRCPDEDCRFGGRKTLPVHVVDEDIYDVRPSIIIGTVDKFAMMAWRPQARRLFGLGNDGNREVSPPSLIIQDELHLISGPLGSMVGLYEVVIDDLCTDKRGTNPVAPKIIASTATIRRYEDQIRGLFGRKQVALFPPHGLEEGHSFFAEPASRDDGSLAPGRRYLGVFSASLGSMQTVQVRVAASTLQAANALPEADRDGYWTNLNFLNSLRELGNTVSLLESDIPDYLAGLRRRDQLTDPRWPRNNMELTSRRQSDEIPKAIEQLQVQYGKPDCVDICLASNIIEVGVDIDRLGLMTIVGQPKTTAQYIQVSGRVGRKAEVSPGLVITLYGAAKPRDRSHYERFRTYHQSLYAQVEPTSVTPFATPVLRRAMHAAVVAHIRQVTPTLPPYPFPLREYGEAVALLKTRATVADKDELDALERMVQSRAREWDRWERTEWDANAIGGSPAQGLMRYAGTLPELNSKATVWDVPTSMRNVDAECQLKISLAYNQADAAAQGDHA